LQWAAAGESANKDDAMKKFFDNLRVLREAFAVGAVLPTVVIVHHSRKSDNTFLGSQVIFASVDGMILCEADGPGVKLTCPGMRDAEAFAPLGLLFETTKIKTDEGLQSDRAIVSSSALIALVQSGVTGSGMVDALETPVLAALAEGPLRAAELMQKLGVGRKIYSTLHTLEGRRALIQYDDPKDSRSKLYRLREPEDDVAEGIV
jgi:hypothetical protein